MILATPAVAQTRVVEGVVFDSLAKKPLANATVSLVNNAKRDQAYTATSDSAGHFVVRDIQPGVYLSGFFHPLLDSLGIQAPIREVMVAQDTKDEHIDLAVPSGRGIRTAICGPMAKNDSSGVFVGHISSATSGVGVAGAKVTAQWSVYGFANGKLTRTLPTLSATAGDNGWFAFCKLPTDIPVRFVAASGADSSGVVMFDVPAFGAAHHDLYVAPVERVTKARVDSGPADVFYRGPAHLRGVVRDAVTKRPIPGVQLTVAGTGTTAIANDAGEFALAQLPLGTQLLSARRVGYMPFEAAVDLLPNDTAHIDIAMPTTKSVLDTVKVIADRIYTPDDNGFYRRQRAGTGHYFDADQIARIRPFETSDLFMRVPSVRVATSGLERTVLMRGMMGGYCQPTFYIDGVLIRNLSGSDFDMMVQPDNIAGIEIYTSPGQAPPELSEGFTQCGIIAVWTRTRPERRPPPPPPPPPAR